MSMSEAVRKKPTIDDMVAMARRDADRSTGYLAGRVASGKLSQKSADFELDTREAIVLTLNLVRNHQTAIRDLVRIAAAEARASREVSQ